MEKQIAQVPHRLLDAGNSELASVYERRMAKPEREKISLIARAVESVRQKAALE